MDRIIIDVREPAEYKLSHAEGAINIPLSRLSNSELLETLPKDTVIVTYCRSGSRSALATSLLGHMGFENCVNATNAEMAEEYAQSITD